MSENAALLSSPFATVAAALFGAIWGSFFNVCIARIPRGESVVRPSSRCEACGVPIRPLDNLPILSYFLLRGRCRRCGAPFSARYPLVEALAALLAAGLWLKFVASDPDQAVAIRVARFALYFVFGGVLVVLAFIDARTRTLPDVITLPAIPVLFLAAFGAHDVPWLERLIGAAAGYLFFRVIADFYYYKLKREGLGLGDAKLMALIGAVLGWKALFFVLFVGAFIGSAVGIALAIAARRRRPESQTEPLRHAQIAFGPFLVLGALIYVFGGPLLIARLLAI
jgi:leader peptidase (prepilin peptidase)/N-methyltransferase